MVGTCLRVQPRGSTFRTAKRKNAPGSKLGFSCAGGGEEGGQHHLCISSVILGSCLGPEPQFLYLLNTCVNSSVTQEEAEALAGNKA